MSDKKKTTRYVSKPSKVAKVKAPAPETTHGPLKVGGVGAYNVAELTKIHERREGERRSATSTGAAGRQDSERRGVAKVTTPNTSFKTVLPKDYDVEVATKAPKTKAPKAPATGLTTKQRKLANQAARVAIRTNDPKAAKRALAGLPVGTKKTKKYTPKLEGIIGKTTAPKTKTQAKAPALSTSPKIKAPKTEKSDPKLARKLARARATNKKLQAEVPRVTAPTTTPDAAKKAVHDVAPIQQPEPKAPTPKAGTRSVGEQLEAARAENVALKGVKGKTAKAPTTTDTSPADTSTAAEELRASKASKKFHSARKASFKKRQAESIRAKGIQTIPIRDTGAEMAETSEAATVRTRKIESDLLTAKAQESTAKPVPKPIAGEGDTRVSTEMFGKEAVKEATQKIAEAPRTDLTLTAANKGAPRYGVNLAEKDRGARAKMADEIRAASSKVKNVAVSRGATPEILESLNLATESEHSRALDSYFDEVEAEKRPMNQAGPRKADAPRRILTSTIDANAELTVARQSASPPAPGDRKTIQEKIDLIKERGKPGGAAIYKGPEAITALENLRDRGEASTGSQLRATRALPPGKDLAAEHFSKTRPSVRAARRAGERAGVGKRPAAIPDLTQPGAVPAGPRTPPSTPAKLHPRVEAPAKSYAQIWSKRMADWGRGVTQKKSPPLTSPAIGSNVGANINKKALARGGVVGATLLAGLVAASTAKAAVDAPAGKKLEAAKKTAAQEGASTAATVGAIGVGIKALGKVKPILGKMASSTLSVAAVPVIAVSGFKIGKLAGKEVSQIKEAKRTAKREKKYSKQFYGTVEKATKTRHAKEAYKRAMAKKEKK